MTQKPSSNLAAFWAFGAVLIAWKVAPAATASDTARAYQWMASGMAGYAAVTLGIQAMRTGDSRPSPWPSLLGRFLWVLRPRSYMIAWALLFAAVSIWGTPHISIEYPPRPCTYLGLSGVHRVPSGSICPWWRWM